jgi:WD40 repeat protein
VPTNSDTQVIAPSEAIYRDLTFSPDGNYIYFRKTAATIADEFDLYRAPVLGGAPQIIVRDIDSKVSFSPDGKRMAYFRDNDPEIGKYQFLTANLDGTGEKMFAGGPNNEGTRNIAWRPGSNQFSAVVSGLGDQLSVLRLFDIDTGQAKSVVSFKDKSLSTTAWLPDGKGLLETYRDQSTNYSRTQIGPFERCECFWAEYLRGRQDVAF